MDLFSALSIQRIHLAVKSMEDSKVSIAGAVDSMVDLLSSLLRTRVYQRSTQLSIYAKLSALPRTHH